MENQPVEDVFPIKNADFPLSCWFSIVDTTTSYRRPKWWWKGRESPQTAPNSGLGIVVAGPELI